jgi:ketosteroid isomerase-like protein
VSGFPILLLLLICHVVHAQSNSEVLLSINAQIDEAVVKKNVAILEKYYADDFVFTHGTGFVEGKASWIKNVANPNRQYNSRVQDSTTVELHGDVALVIGKIEIKRMDKDKKVSYGIWYIRVYRKNTDVWQMISHRTTGEWHH